MNKTSQILSSFGCCMYSKTMRVGLMAATVASFLAFPAESHAIFHWLRRCLCNDTTPTFGAAPLASAAPAAVDPCAPPQVTQTVNYVPQTCYRTQYVNVPVTTYRPVAGRDPCTGCPVTTLRPSTTVVRQAQLVPYTTYRRVLTNTCGAPAATASYTSMFRGIASYPATRGCSSCGGSSPTYAPAATPTYNGATPTYAPAAATPTYNGAMSGATGSSSSGYSPSSSYGSSSSYSPSNGYGSSNSYGSSSSYGASSGYGASSSQTGTPILAPSGTPTYQQQKPIPDTQADRPEDQAPQTESGSNSNGSGSTDAGTTSGTGAILSPRLFQPNDRTTQYPILRARLHRPVSYQEPLTEPAAPAAPAAEDDGWRPSTR